MNKKLYRSKNDALISGVCGGIGEYFSVDSNIIRLIFILFGFFGMGVLFYILFWVFIPINSDNINNNSNTTSNNGSKIFNMDKNGNIFRMSNQNSNKNTLAILFLVAGCLFLLNNIFGIFDYFSLYKIWPVLLIILGVILLIKRNKNN